MKMLLVIALAAAVLLASSTIAGIPQMINYQGRLTDTGGVPATGLKYMQFKIYDASTGGNILWSNLDGLEEVQVTDGLFSYLLGATRPLPDSLKKYDSLWLGIRVSPDPEMTPRTRLVAGPFSIRSRSAQIADTAAHSLDRTTSASDLLSGTLDTMRYSAYTDLVSENRIGLNADQVASGNHSHNGSGVQFLEDTAFASSSINSSQGEVTIKSVTIPANTIGSYFHIIVGTTASNVLWSIYINNQYVFGHSRADAKYVFSVNAIKKTGLSWLATTDDYDGVATGVGLDVSQPITIKITATALAAPTIAEVGTVIVEVAKK